MKIFPNPVLSTEMLTVLLDAAFTGSINLTLRSISGQVISQKAVTKAETSLEVKLDLKKCKRGIYLLNAENNGLSTTQKLIIQ